MTNIISTIRFASRGLLKRPTSTLLAILALALGIGMNTAIFSVVNKVLLRPLPFRDPDQIVSVWERGLRPDIDRNELAPANFLDIRAHNQAFTHVGAFGEKSLNLSGVGEPERLDGLLVSGDALNLLGVQPMLGRIFYAEEDQPGNDQVVVLSYRLWHRRFNGDPTVIGQKITLDSQPFTVVGVMPEGFFFPERSTELWTPLAMGPDEAAGRGDHYLRAVARLKPGVTTTQADGDLQALGFRLQQEFPRTNEGLQFFASSFHDDYIGNVRQHLWLMLAAVALVLLIACANVANLLLAQLATRRKEISIRAALGATRWSILRQFFVESLLLSIAGGCLGIPIALWGVSILSAFIPETLSQIGDVNVDARVLLFTLGVSLLSAVIFGLFPALHASRAKPIETMKEIGIGSGGLRAATAKSTLLVMQVALAVLLLVSAGLLLRSLLGLLNVDAGIRTDNLLTMRMVLPTPKYREPERRWGFYDEVLRRIREIPQVEATGIISFLPLSFSGMNFSFSIEGQPLPNDNNLPLALYRVVSPDYFRAMGITLHRGRSFDAHDNADSQPVVVINHRLANHYWPGIDPTGRRLKIGSADSPNPWATVVGVVGDVRQGGLYDDPRLELYAPYAQDRRGFVAPRDLVVRTKADPKSIVNLVRAAVWQVDKDQPVSNIRTMDQVVSDTVSRERFQTLLLGLFAVLALLLACIGVYGLISYAVASRTSEIGLRMALGAQRRDVVQLVTKRALVLTVLGIALGLLASFAGTRVLRGMLFGVTPTDPVTFVLVPALFVVVALVACYIPARRATKVDPLVALRYE